MYFKSLDYGPIRDRRRANFIVALALFAMIAAPALAVGLRLVS